MLICCLLSLVLQRRNIFESQNDDDCSTARSLLLELYAYIICLLAIL